MLFILKELGITEEEIEATDDDENDKIDKNTLQQEKKQ